MPAAIVGLNVGRAPLTRPTNETTDGRRIKGERRRRALIDAALRVVERDGAAGVTHRTVAREAGLPTTASTYYFDSIDALLTAALTTSLDEDSERIRALLDEPDASLRALAELMAETVAARGHLVAEFELCLIAARRPELRGPVNRWAEALAAFARLHTGDPVRVKVFVGSYDGLLLRALLSDEPVTADDFEALLGGLLP